MKAKVFVTLKRSVLDPQGKAIGHSIRSLGYGNVGDVRQGKYFEIELDGVSDPEEAKRSAEKVAKEVLTNPVIEDFSVEII